MFVKLAKVVNSNGFHLVLVAVASISSAEGGSGITFSR